MMDAWQVGGSLPDIEYPRSNRGMARLSDLWSEGPALFVWLRHCGCVFFDEALSQLRAQAPDFAERGVHLACIVQATPEGVREVCGSEILCIPDPESWSHQAMGFGRVGLLRMLLSPAFWRRWRQASRAGFRQSWRRTFQRESDTRRLPGAVLVSRGGRILWVYRGEHPGDLPRADELLAVASEFATPVRL